MKHLPLLALTLLASCSASSRDRLWEKIDPAGYKHAHSESFNGAHALPTRVDDADSDEMAMGLKP